MIDIHNHILPGIDDGSDSFEESLQMCRLAQLDGITHIIATPHFVKGKYWPSNPEISELLSKLQEKLAQENIDLTILPGSDVYLYPELIKDIQDKKIPTINGTQYILLELPSTFHISHILNFLAQLQKENIVPIISHPERNPQIQDDPGILKQLVSNGVLIQVTALSITGGFGAKVKTTVDMFLSQGFVHVIASDAHSTRRRVPVLSSALEEASKIIGFKKALDMVTTIPRKIIEGKPVSVPKPIELISNKIEKKSSARTLGTPMVNPIRNRTRTQASAASGGIREFKRPRRKITETISSSSVIQGKSRSDVTPGKDKSLGLFDTLIQLGLLALIVFTPWYYGTVELWTQALVQIAVLSIFSLWLIKGFIQKDFILVKTPLDLPIFIFLLLCLVYTAFSAYLQESVFELNKILSFLMLYYIAVNTLRTPVRMGFFLCTIILTALFYSVYGLLQYYGYLPTSFWTQPGSLASRFVNSSHFAGYLQLSIFLCIGMILRKGVCKKIFSGSICIVLLIALAYTRSRAVWVSFLAGIGFMAFLLSKFRLISINRGFVLVFFSIICVFLVTMFGGDIMATRMGELFSTQFQSINQRFDIWRSSWNLFSNQPLGMGLGVFSIVYPQYRLHSDRFFVNYAHNEILQVGSELGLLGLFVLLWLVVRYYSISFKVIKLSGDSERGILLISFAAAFTALFVQSMVDFPVHIYAIAFLLLFLLAINMHNLSSSIWNVARRLYLKRMAIGLILLCIPLYSINLTKIYRGDLCYRRGQELEKKFEWNKAIKEYQRAVSLVPGNAAYYEGIGSIYAQRAALSIEKGDYLEKAIKAYKAASLNSPHNADYHRELAFLYSDKGEKQLAVQEFKKAVMLMPTDGSLRLEYGYFCLRKGMIDNGIEQLKRAQFLFHEDSTGSLDRILKECYRYTQDYNKLKKVIIDNTQSHLQLGRFLLSKGMVEGAKKEFLRVLEFNPTNRIAKRALRNLKL